MTGLKQLLFLKSLRSYSEVPSEYTQKTYLASSGYQYIETGYMPVKDDEIAIRFCDESASSTHCLLSAGTSTYQLILLLDKYTLDSGVKADMFYYKYFSSGGAATSNYAGEVGVWYDATIDKNGILKIGEHETTSLYGGSIDGDNKTVWIMKRRNNTSGWIGKVGRVTITNNGIKTIDLIPCVRKSDNVAGMYDTVSRTFLTNSGTGEFTTD